VATQPGQVIEDGQQPIEEEAATPPEGQQPTELEEDGDDEPPPAPDPVEDLAKGMGWRPKDQFRGDPNLWKPADEHIRAGAEIQKGMSRDLKDMRHTVDAITKTNAAILKQTIDAERDKLVAQYNRAVEDGDARSTFQIGRQIDGLNGQVQQLTQPVPQPAAPEAEAWVARNSWFTQDPLAHDLAMAVAQRYSDAGHAADKQLEAAEREVRKVYPHLFAGSSKPAPGVAQPGGRSGQAPVKGTTYADMPEAAKKVAKDMAERGVIPNKEAYAKQYWKSQGKGA